MKRVLIVAYYFPPIAGIGSIRLSRFAHYLPEFGWEPIVLAPRGTPHPSDPALSFDEGQVIRAPSLELSRISGSASGVPTSASKEHEPLNTWQYGASRRMRQAAKRLVFPDAQVGWWPAATAAGARLVRRERVDAVFSSSFPITAHLVAGSVSRVGRVPWLAEFRDPWSDRLPRVPYRRAARGLERWIARNANRVAMPTPTWAAYYGKAWGTDITVLPNGHELEPACEDPAEPPTLAHVGSHYSDHYCDFSSLWEALAQRARQGEPLPRVQWVGAVPDGVAAQASAVAGVAIQATGPVSHELAIQRVKEASMLFASGPRSSDPVSRGWVPAKLFEYIGSGRPVLFVGDPQGDAAALLRGEPGCFVCQPDDSQGMLAALESGLSAPSSPRRAEGMSRRARSQELARLLDSMGSAH